MTDLEAIIDKAILDNGPIPISHYMELCLSHPEHGYYTTKNPIGAAGDFTTAPEISQIFGEMIGIWLLQSWLDLGSPPDFILAELGPGRGTLMADILRVGAQNAGFTKAMQVILVETSPSLRKIQKQSLGGFSIRFCETINEIPELPILLVANEFYDALPIQQFVSTDIGWQERRINTGKGGLQFVLSKPEPNRILDERFPDLANGHIVEQCEAGQGIAAQTGAHITKFGGAALIIDYGEKTGIGDTFQAVKDHAPVNPLRLPGQCDLTAQVQFDPIVNSAKCAAQFTTQGAFLENMGVTARAQNLARNLPGKAAISLKAAHRRLVHPDEMGAQFKVLALHASDDFDLVGFE